MSPSLCLVLKVILTWYFAQMRETIQKLQFRIDRQENDHKAVIVDFNGPKGLVIIGREWLKTGAGRYIDGVHLYIVEDARAFGDGSPDVRFVH